MPKVKQSSIRNRRYKSKGRAEQLRQAREKRENGAEAQNIDSNQHFENEPTPSTSCSAAAPIPSCSQTPTDCLPRISVDIRSEGFQAAASPSDSDSSIDSGASSESQSDDETPHCDSVPCDNGTDISAISSVDNTELPTTICDMNKVADLFATCACPECGHAALRMTCDKEVSKGLALCLQVACSNCHEVVGKSYTSARMPNDNCFEINRRSVVASIMCGFGAKKFNKLCEALNIPGLNQKTFHNHCDAVYALTPETKQHILQLAVQAVRYEHQQLDQTLARDDIYDIAVSYDGSWLTRGHSSQIGSNMCY